MRIARRDEGFHVWFVRDEQYSVGEVDAESHLVVTELHFD